MRGIPEFDLDSSTHVVGRGFEFVEQGVVILFGGSTTGQAHEHSIDVQSGGDLQEMVRIGADQAHQDTAKQEVLQTKGTALDA